MKKNIFILIVASIICFSCEDFLEEKSQDKIIPTDVTHFKELIYGELIERRSEIGMKTDLMSDDVAAPWWTSGIDQDQRTTYYQFYTWKKSIESNIEDLYERDEMYEILYKHIVLCNAIEDQLADASGAEAEKLNAYAETYFFRALSYLELANLYSTPYVDEASSLTTPCVPLNKNKGIGMDKFTRATQREIYDQIEKDIENAVMKFEEAGIAPTIYRPNHTAACILATRIYLYQKKYDKVIEYANKISNLTNLYNMSDYVSNNGTVEITSTFEWDSFKPFMNSDNTEIAFTLEDEYNDDTFRRTGTNKGSYMPGSTLRDSYEDGDLRKSVFFDTNGMLVKVSFYYSPIYSSNFRITEALLNRAEAYANTDPAKAFADLTTLRSFRFDGTAPELSGDALDAVKLERRKELCFEGLRWFDLRRWGMPKIVHEYYLNDGERKEIWTLEENDAGYTLSLPEAVTEINESIEDHERPERTAVIEFL